MDDPAGPRGPENSESESVPAPTSISAPETTAESASTLKSTTTAISLEAEAATAASTSAASVTAATDAVIKSAPAKTVTIDDKQEQEARQKTMRKLKAALARRIKDGFYVRSLCEEIVR